MRNLLVDFMNRKQKALPNNPERKLEKTALGLNNIKESPMSRVALNFWGKENLQIQSPQSKSRFLWFQEIQDPVQNLAMREGGMFSVPSGVWTMAEIPQNLSSSLPVKSYIDDQLKESLNKWIEAKKSERRARDKAKEEAKKLQQEKIEKSKRSYQFWTLIQMANESWGDLSRMDTIDKKTANEYFPDLYNDSKGFRNLKTNLEKVFAGEKEYGELLAAYAENKPWYIDDWYTKEEKQWLKQGGRRSETLQNKPLWGKIGDALDSINIVWKGWEELDNLAQKIPTANSFLKMENRETKLQNRVKGLSEEERWALEDKYETSPLLKTLYGNFDNYLKATQRTFGDELFDVWYTGVGPNLGKMFANIPSSTVKTLTATGRWITNPADTVAGIGQMLLTEEGRSAMKDRYWNNLDKTIEEDPIGTASDALTVAELGAKGVSGGLKVSGLTKNAKIWAVSQKVADFGKTAWEVADLGLSKLYWKGMERLRDVQKNSNNILLKAGATYLRSTQEPLKVASEWLNAGVNKLIGLDKRTKQALENNPFVWKYFEKTKEYIEENGLSPESKKEINTEHIRGLSSEILDMIENKKDTLRDTGELYEKIKNANVKFESTGVKEKLNSYLDEHGIRIIDWKLDFSDSVIVKEGDMKAIEKAYDRATREGYQAKVGLNQRKKMDKIAYPDGAPSAWTEIIRGMRSIFDENMKEKIPGLKEADKLYSEKIKELEQIEDGLIYKQGNRKGQLRDNFEQIVNTLDWPNRARMLQRLDELRPGLGDEIKAVHMMGKLTDMYFKTPTKLSGYLTNAAGIVWGGAIGSRYGIGGMIVGAISGWLVKQGATKLSQNAIRKAIDNVAPSSLARLKEIEAKIQAGKGMSPEERMLIDQIGEKILQESELLNNTRNKEQALSAPKIENKEIIEIDKRPRNILWGKLVKNEKKSGGNVSNSTLDGWSITKKTEIARKNGLDVDEKWDPYYKRTNGETIKYSSDGRRKRDYERDGFTHAYEFPLKPEYKKYVKELQKVRDGVKDSTTLTKMPGTLFDDKVAKDLTIDTKIYEKSFKKHGVIDTANLLTTANEYEYAIKMDDGSHFNLLKKIPNSDKYLLIGADLNKNTNGKDMYVLTYYEPTNSLKEALDKSISKEREIFQRNGDIVGGFLTRNNNFKLIKEWELITPEKSKWKNILVPFMNKSPKWGEKYQVAKIYQQAGSIYSDNFKKWFGDWENDPKHASKIVDDKGNPMIMYHGTDADFSIFDKQKIQRWKWFWFTKYQDVAEWYSLAGRGWSSDPQIMEVYLDVKNPATLDDVNWKLLDDFRKETGKMVSPEAFIHDRYASEFMLSRWYDGLMFDDIVIVYRPEQIKSATDNIWTFNKNNPDIRYQKYGVADATEKTITPERAKELKNFRNGRSVEEIAKDYGVEISIVDKITTPEGARAYGKYGDGVITLAEKIKEGTAPHELFHATFDMVDHARKETILEGVMEEKKLDKIQAEEYLADSFSEYFRTWRMKGEKVIWNVGKPLWKKLYDAVKDFFKQVKDWITGVSKNKKQVKQLFDDILDGEIDREMLGESLGNKKRNSTTRPNEGETTQSSNRRIIHITDDNARYFKKNLDDLVKSDSTPEDFFQWLKDAFGSEKKSAYVDREIDGEVYNLRIADHTATARNFAFSKEYTNNTSLVIKIGEKRFKGDKRVDLVEYVYNKEDLTLEKKKGIIKGLKDWMHSWEYSDKWYNEINKSIRATLENGEVKYQRVYHGSPYEFEKFDSAHMGKGEGAQAHGWGHYVAVDKKTGIAYAENNPKVEYKWTQLNEFVDNIANAEQEEVSKIMWSMQGLNNNFEMAKKQRMSDLMEWKSMLEDDLEYVDKNSKTYKDIQSQVKEINKSLDYLSKLNESDFVKNNGNLYEVEIPDTVKVGTPTGSNYLEEGWKIKSKAVDRIVKKLKEWLSEEKLAELDELIDSRESWYDHSIGWWRMYRILERILWSDKKASKFLEGLWYDGIHYHWGQDWEVYVIFDDNKLEIKKHEKL